MENLPSVIYIFDCPWHGNESQVFCFRASQSELKDRWHKFLIESKEVPFDSDTDELYWIIEKMKGTG